MSAGVDTELLIVGAGPFGLAMAAQARALGVEHLVVGEPMSFWKRHMPAGMVLRSRSDWHLDPTGVATVDRFLGQRGQVRADVEPLPLDLYLEYARWFEQQHEIHVRPSLVTRIDRNERGFEARTTDGTVFTAGRVLLALGFAPFARIPAELSAFVPRELSSHTRDLRRPRDFSGRRVLIVGGRQSAFETAALLAEAGASAVHVCHRHDTPSFSVSDWSWVEPVLTRIAADPSWFRGLSRAEREELDGRFWAEGRLKLEPWLGPRVQHEAITSRPRTRVVAAERYSDALRVQLDAGEPLAVDHVLYATGYAVDLERVPFLREGGLLDRIECRQGYPVLDDTLQTTVPGLHMTSLPAVRDFGLFFAFTAAVRASAHLVGRACARGA